MSWGATAFTPLITYNHPPFGFTERQNPSDYPTCPENPYSATENIKEATDQMFREKRQLPDEISEPFINISMEHDCDKNGFIINSCISLYLLYLGVFMILLKLYNFI